MSGHEFASWFPESGSVDMHDRSTNIGEQTMAELRELAARYPQPRSALLPMLHLVQSVDGRVSPAGVEACAEVLGISTAQVSGVATFYTMYKRRPAGTHHVGVCTTALCAVMGGDVLLDACSKKLGIGPDETTADGSISLERIECNAACDYAPVMMVNWEFFDNMTPESADQLLDDLRSGKEVHSPRGARLTSWKEAERVLAGFPDGLADEGPSAGDPSLLGLRIAHENGWTAPDVPPPAAEQAPAEQQPAEQKPADAPADKPAEDKPADSSADKPADGAKPDAPAAPAAEVSPADAAQSDGDPAPSLAAASAQNPRAQTEQPQPGQPQTADRADQVSERRHGQDEPGSEGAETDEASPAEPTGESTGEPTHPRESNDARTSDAERERASATAQDAPAEPTRDPGPPRLIPTEGVPAPGEDSRHQGGNPTPPGADAGYTPAPVKAEEDPA